jgi:hypothetical protein
MDLSDQQRFEDFYLLTANRVKCLRCNDIIESTHRYDFVKCKCGDVYTDGGLSYLRRGATNFKNLQDLSSVRPMTEEEIDAYISRNQDTGTEYSSIFKEWREERVKNAVEFKKLMYGN